MNGQRGPFPIIRSGKKGVSAKIPCLFTQLKIDYLMARETIALIIRQVRHSDEGDDAMVRRLDQSG